MSSVPIDVGDTSVLASGSEQDMSPTPAADAERRLAAAIEQQAATSEILRAISQSPADVQPVFELIARSALALCRAASANVFTYDGRMLHVAAFVNINPDYGQELRRVFP